MKTIKQIIFILLLAPLAHAAPRQLIGLKPVTVVRINSQDFQQSCTEDELRDLYYRSPRNIQGFFEANSQGMFSYADATILRAQLPYGTNGGCDYKRYSSDARAMLKLSSRPTGAVVYVLPTNNCSFSGLAQLSTGNGNAWIRADNCLTFDTHLHQLGHINGFDHAATDLDDNGAPESLEGDVSDPMGYTQIGIKHFNAPHKKQAGWLMTIITPPVGQHSYALSPLELNGPALIYPRSSRTSYFIAYRTAGDPYSVGLDGDFHRKLSIHWAGPSGRTYLITTLAPGDSWVDRNGGIVTLDSEDGATAQVTVRR